jgi:hypothetical protein
MAGVEAGVDDFTTVAHMAVFDVSSCVAWLAPGGWLCGPIALGPGWVLVADDPVLPAPRPVTAGTWGSGGRWAAPQWRTDWAAFNKLREAGARMDPFTKTATLPHGARVRGPLALGDWAVEREKT